MTSLRTLSSSSLTAGKIDGRAREFFWGITLDEDKPEQTWTLKDEDNDADFFEHTLFLRHAVLGAKSVEGERNIVSVVTQTYAGDEVEQPLFSLTNGKMDMCQLDINFGSEQPVTFKLVKGTGPVHLSAQQLVEFPPEELDDTECGHTEDESGEADIKDELEEEEEQTVNGAENGVKPKGKKRKAIEDKIRRKKKGKASTDEDEDNDDEPDEEDEEEEEESMEEEDESEESSPEKEKKKKKKAAVKSKVMTKAAKKEKAASSSKKSKKK